MKKNVISLVKVPDLIFSKIYLRLFKEKNSLMTFIFHGLFNNGREIDLNLVDPQPWITVQQFQQFVKYYFDRGYKFISPDDLLQKLTDDKRYILITFDDGYFNNIRALSILKKYKVPAVFFISTNNVKYNKCFWWDVLYREMKKLGKSESEIIHKQRWLKTKTNDDIENYLIKEFGKDIFNPRNNIDRPFTHLELKDFSKEKYVFLGNHTSDHGILTNYSTDEIRSQILNAQKTLYDITGIKPLCISYPDGAYSDKVINISKEIGFKFGITTNYKKNYLPLDCNKSDCMRLGRFDLSSSSNIIKQCELFRSDFLFYACIRNFFNNRKAK